MVPPVPADPDHPVPGQTAEALPGIGPGAVLQTPDLLAGDKGPLPELPDKIMVGSPHEDPLFPPLPVPDGEQVRALGLVWDVQLLKHPPLLQILRGQQRISVVDKEQRHDIAPKLLTEHHLGVPVGPLQVGHHRISRILPDGPEPIGGISQPLGKGPPGGRVIEQHRRIFSLGQPQPVLPVHNGAAGEDVTLFPHEHGHVPLLPADEIAADRVSPVHVVPVVPRRIVLVKQMVHPVQINQPVGVVDPPVLGGKMSLGPQRLPIDPGKLHPVRLLQGNLHLRRDDQLQRLPQVPGHVDVGPEIRREPVQLQIQLVHRPAAQEKLQVLVLPVGVDGKDQVLLADGDLHPAPPVTSQPEAPRRSGAPPRTGRRCPASGPPWSIPPGAPGTR